MRVDELPNGAKHIIGDWYGVELQNHPGTWNLYMRKGKEVDFGIQVPEREGLPFEEVVKSIDYVYKLGMDRGWNNRESKLKRDLGLD